VDNLNEKETFGSSFKEGDDAGKYSEELLLFIERKVYGRISRRVNFLLKMVNNQKLELIDDGNTDKDQNGNWKIAIISGDLKVQKRIDDVWVTSRTYSG
jgi:hypothetical protein